MSTLDTLYFFYTRIKSIKLPEYFIHFLLTTFDQKYEVFVSNFVTRKKDHFEKVTNIVTWKEV